jgi:hypothetical protein
MEPGAGPKGDTMPMLTSVIQVIHQPPRRKITSRSK